MVIFAGGDRGPLKTHAETIVDRKVATQGGFILKLFHIEPVRASVSFPIKVPQIIPRGILAVLRKLDGISRARIKVLALFQ